MNNIQSVIPSRELTIVVPVTNMSGRLRWIEGLLTGHIGPVIIIHDVRDASTAPELAQLVAGFPSSTLLEGRFGSPGAARVAGLEKVKTQFVAFMDSDDETFGGYGAVQLALKLIETGGDICAGAFQVNHLNSGSERMHPVADTFESSLRSHPGIWRYVFRVEFLRKTGVTFSEIKMGEDLLFLLDCYLAGAHYQSLPILVYGYNLGVQGQATSSKVVKRDLLALMKYLEERFVGASMVARSLISFLWMKSFLSAAKNLTESTDRVRLTLYFLHQIFVHPQLVIRGLIQVEAIMQKAGNLENEPRDFR